MTELPARRPSLSAPTRRRFLADDRGDVPMRIAPMILIGLTLIVLAILGGALL